MCLLSVAPVGSRQWGRFIGGFAMRRRHLASACLFALLITLLSAAAPASAAPRPDGRGEVLGPATRSTAPTSPAVTAAVPSGFSDTAVWSGLTLPTAIAF